MGQTLGQAAVDDFGAQGSDAETFDGLLRNGALRLGTDALVAAALNAYSKPEAEDYLDNSVGQEVGQFIAGAIKSGLPSPSSIPSPSSHTSAQQPAANAGSSAYGTEQESGAAGSSADDTVGTQSTAQTTGPTTDQADGATVDANGNPVATEPSLEQIQFNPQLVQPASVVVGQEGAHGFRGVAQSMLGPDASNADIQNLAQELMPANPGVTVLHAGDVLNPPSDTISAEAQQSYAEMNQTYQAELAQAQTENLGTPATTEFLAAQQQAITNGAPAGSEADAAAVGTTSAAESATEATLAPSTESPSLSSVAGNFFTGLKNGFVNTTDSIGSYLADQAIALKQGGIAATDVGKAYNAAVDFTSDEFEAASIGGFSNTRTAAALYGARDFLSYVADQGISGNLQAAQEFTSNLIESGANYYDTHTANQLAYSAGNFVGSQAPGLILTAGAGTALEAGGEALTAGSELLPGGTLTGESLATGADELSATAASTAQTAEDASAVSGSEEILSTTAANRATALDFYVNKAGFTEAKALQHIEGIDLTQPVSVTTLVIMERPAPDLQHRGLRCESGETAAQSRMQMGAGDEKRTICRA